MSLDGGASPMGVAGALGLSVTSSVAIVICNKYLIRTLGFFFDDREGLGAKSSPWQESKEVESFDDVPRTAKIAFGRHVNA